MFAGPLANFLLSIFIFSIIFLNTPDPQTVSVIKSVDSSISFQSSNQFILPGDQISSIDNAVIRDPKDLNLELLSYAGFTGFIDLNLKRVDIDDLVNVSIYVEDFLPTSEAQSNPLKNLGLITENKMKPIIGQVLSEGSASSGNMRPNDVVLKIDNSKIYYASDIRNAISTMPNRNVLIEVSRDDEILKLPITVGVSVNSDGDELGVLGVSFGTSRSFAQAFSKGVFETYNLSLKTLQFIGKMLTGNMGTDNLSGPIGIAQMAGDTAQAGLLPFMYLMALLSISLAVLNLLPIPVLDGGQLTLLGIEAIRGKPLPEKVENYIYSGGGFLVLALMIFAVFNDVARFF
jgi:regulator of sigma E protease